MASFPVCVDILSTTEGTMDGFSIVAIVVAMRAVKDQIVGEIHTFDSWIIHMALAYNGWTGAECDFLVRMTAIVMLNQIQPR